MRDCENCKNHTDKGCTKWECEFWPTTKNDIPHCQHTDDEEIAQSFKEDVEAVKDLLPCGEHMDFPSTFDEFANDYGFKDKEEVYTNGSELIPVFRVKQWLEHISTPKNDLGVDCISRAQTQAVMEMYASRYTISKERGGMGQVEWSDRLIKASDAVDIIRHLPPVIPQEPKTGHWISTETKGVRYAFWCRYKCSLCGGLSDRTNFCPNCGCRMVEPQESEDKE